MHQTVQSEVMLRARTIAGAAVAFLVVILSAAQVALAQTPSPLRRVNVPDLTGQPFAPAIFWLGRVGMNTNYADVRAWYYAPYLRVVVHMTDRVLWYDPSGNTSQLASWDAVSLFIDIGGNAGAAPRSTSYRFMKQLESAQRADRGDGIQWTSSPLGFSTASSWRGNYPNDDVWDMGWVAEFQIPFSSLGLSGPPPTGTVWGLGLVVHDRDDLAGTPIPDQLWPESLNANRPDSWGQLRFGLPIHTPQTQVVAGTTVVRQGLNGAAVPDAAVGGHTICGDPMNAWTEWGNANYAGFEQFNIQNQWDIADFMCFSKYFVTFPLTAVPPGKVIVSARVTLSLFGNSGYNPGDAMPSAIHTLTVSADWNENAITWNNAPYAEQNTSVTWVHPVDADHHAGPYAWDVSYALAEAYHLGRPLQLCLLYTSPSPRD